MSSYLHNHMHNNAVILKHRHTDLFRGVLWQEGGDDKVYEAAFSQNIEDEKVSVANGTGTILHFVYSRLKTLDKWLISHTLDFLAK